MLPSDELARLRSDIQYTMPDLCEIYSVTSARDGYGGVTNTWALVTTVPCRLDQQRGRESMAGGGMRWFTANVLSLPHTTTITTANRVIVNGVTYSVVSVNEGSGIAVKRAIVERVAQ